LAKYSTARVAPPKRVRKGTRKEPPGNSSCHSSPAAGSLSQHAATAITHKVAQNARLDERQTRRQL
jgi:hypothetical protein